MKSMEEMIQAAQKAAETIQKQMEDAQGRLDAIEVEAPPVVAWSASRPRPRGA
jgi:hypothetical protein